MSCHVIAPRLLVLLEGLFGVTVIVVDVILISRENCAYPAVAFELILFCMNTKVLLVSTVTPVVIVAVFA